MEFKLVKNETEKIWEYRCSDPYWWDENGKRHDYGFIPGLTFYRYHNSYGGINCYKFKALRETPCGYWILDGKKEKWVGKTSMRRFCYPTKKEAWHNFKCRKKKQIQLLKSQLSHIRNVLREIYIYEKDEGDPDSPFYIVKE